MFSLLSHCGGIGLQDASKSCRLFGPNFRSTDFWTKISWLGFNGTLAQIGHIMPLLDQGQID